jgi:hypothetical protein
MVHFHRLQPGDKEPVDFGAGKGDAICGVHRSSSPGNFEFNAEEE